MHSNKLSSAFSGSSPVGVRLAWSLVVLAVVGFLHPPGALGYEVTVGFEGPSSSGYYSEKGFYFTSSGFFGPSFLLEYGFDDPDPFHASRPFPISGNIMRRF